MVQPPPSDPDLSADVVVIGSGTGLVAALAAADRGAETVVLEKDDAIGGTTAVSNAGIWVPNAPPLVEAHGRDDEATMAEYIERVAGEAARPELIEAFLRHGPDAVRYLESETPLEFEARPIPDYHPEWPGGSAAGHTFAPKLYDGDRLGDALADLKDNPHSPFPYSSEDLAEHGGFAKLPMALSAEEIERRQASKQLAGGQALIGGLYEACLEAGVEFYRNAPAVELHRDGHDGPVRGVTANIDGAPQSIAADAVIIAAGGIDWDRELCDNLLRGPMTAPATPPAVDGDGLRLGMDVGAKLGNLNEAWWFPTTHIGQSWDDGSPVYRMVWPERALPGAVMVNGEGERFVNESRSYHDLAKTFHHFDPESYDYENVPCYTVFDHDFRQSYALFLSLEPGDDDPPWLTSAESVSALADTIDVPAERLRETIERFNRHAREGEDPDFNRGESAHDRQLGDPDAAHPNLAPVDEPPFYAFEVKPGSLGTKGGLVTTPSAGVLDTREQPIEGLYAVGNSTAHVMGIGYAGGGATLGPNITFAYVAGREATS